jgi:hypothetical protein
VKPKDACAKGDCAMLGAVVTKTGDTQ